MNFSFVHTDNFTYSKHYAIYGGSNIYLSYDWNEYLDSCNPDNCGYFIFRDGIFIGGVIIKETSVSAPFLIPPYNDFAAFWKTVINYINSVTDSSTLHFIDMNEINTAALVSLGTVRKWSQRRMCRVTSEYKVKPPESITFEIPSDNDKDEIIQVVHKAHSNGYTSEIFGKPDITETEKAISRRYTAFKETQTLHFSTIAHDNSEIVGVCIAGIYPDSKNNFSTIHQVSVLPEYRRKGLAETMILSTVNKACTLSPVITLGVLVGNPAELLYSKLGFVSGQSYSNLILPSLALQ